MAKKSNKTEHVLKLITKSDESAQNNDFFTVTNTTENSTPEVKEVVLVEPDAFLEEIELGLDQMIGAEVIPETKSQELPDKGPDEQAETEKTTNPSAETETAAAQETDAVLKLQGQQEASEEDLSQHNKPAEQEPPTIRAFREQAASGSVTLEPSEDLINIAEVLAREKISLVMDRMNVCMCKTCINDVLALALNSLPTKYVTTDAGKQFFQRDEYKKQYETEILAALTKACVRVKASPRH